jgi:hypothetical protein
MGSASIFDEFLVSRGKQHLLGVAGFNLNRRVWTRG